MLLCYYYRSLLILYIGLRNYLNISMYTVRYIPTSSAKRNRQNTSYIIYFPSKSSVRNSDAQWDCRRSECLYGKLHVTESREKVSYQLKYHCRWSLSCWSQSSQKRKLWRRRRRMKLKEKRRASFSHLTSFFFSVSNLALQAEVTELQKNLKGIPFLSLT